MSGQKVHFVGVGGIGMSGLAKVMLEQGCEVSGSDLHPNTLTQRLAEMGARIYGGHDAANVNEADLVVISSAVPADNVELAEAGRRELRVIKRAEMLARLCEGRRLVAVAGTHGKTTTSAMIAWALLEAGLDPTLLVGGELLDLGTNARLGRGQHLVAEADEFDGSFLSLHPFVAVLTNIEPDHLDYYGTVEALGEAFARFLAQVSPQGHIVACSDDLRLRALLELRRHSEGSNASLGAAGSPHLANQPTPQVVAYSLHERTADWRAADVRLKSDGSEFTLMHLGKPLGRCRLGLPGRHNVANALGAIAAADVLGVTPERAMEALARFSGTRRRFEVRGEAGGVTVVEDYAHHPTEIAATLAAARQRFPCRRLVAVFQPHTFSRTRLLFDEFARCFAEADEATITDIYAAREQNVWGSSSAELAQAIKRPPARYIADMHAAAAYLAESLRPGDVLLVLGAGDINEIVDEVLKGLSR